MQPHWTQPSHPEVLEVISQPGSFMTYAIAKADFEPGSVLARLTAPTLTIAPRAYSSVQVGPSQSIELNCDFLYINHSCEPNVEFVISSHGLNEAETTTPSSHEHPAVIEIRAASRKNAQGQTVGIAKGEELSFFYPSTEWDMSQPFDCKCKTSSCKGVIRGAKHLSRSDLADYFINEHILQQKAEQEESGVESRGSAASNNTTSGGSGVATPSHTG